MEFPPPSEQQVELAELDREIARRQTELTALIEQRMALTPLQHMPPPQGAPVPQHQGTGGAKAILALGAAVLIAEDLRICERVADVAFHRIVVAK